MYFSLLNGEIELTNLLTSIASPTFCRTKRYTSQDQRS